MSRGARLEPAPRSVAILSDVHANLPALDAVARDLADDPPERVVVNGDMVNRGPSGLQVLEAIDANGWTMTLGNHDDLLRLWTIRDPSIPRAWFDDPFWRSTAWCADQLRDTGWLERFASLPLTLAIEPEDGADVLISHGSPRHYREGYGRHLPDEAISEIVEMHPYALLVGSHTHQPLERRYGRHLVLNSGAVGTPFNGDPRSQYLRLTREGAGWRHAFRRVAYDRAAALEAFPASGFLEAAGLSARIYWLEAATARSWLVPFLMWAEQHGADRDEAAWARFVRDRGRPLDAPDAEGADAVRRSGLAVAP